MNTISDSLIEKLEELYPKPKPEIAEEPVTVKQSATDYTITSGGSTYSGNYASSGGYAIQSTYAGINFPPTWGAVTTPPITVLDQMKVKETSVSYETTLKQYFDCKMIDLECKIKDHIKQEIDKLKCSPGTPT
jgi:hypothetical protein